MADPGLGLGRSLVSREPPQDPAATAFFARLTNQPTASRALLYNNFFRSLRAAGLLGLLDAVYILAAADSQAALLNLVQNAFNGAVVGAPVFAVDRGYTGTGVSNNKLNTLFNPTTSGQILSQNSGHLSAWSLSSVPNGGLIGGNSDTTFGISVSGGFMVGRMFDSDATQLALAPSYYLISRTGAAARSFYKDGVGFPDTTASGTVLSAGVTILEAGAGFSSSQIAFATIGGGLTDANVTALYNAARTYLQGVGAV